MIVVNCSHQHITTLPSKLPTFTSTLIMRGNMVIGLFDELFHNANHTYVRLLLENGTIAYMITDYYYFYNCKLL